MFFIKYIEANKRKTAFFMLPLLVLLLFSCPVKRALNPSFSASALSVQSGNDLNKKASAVSFINPSPCPSAGKVIEKSIVVPHQKENLSLPSLFLPVSGLFGTPFTIDKRRSFIVNRSSYISFSVPLFLKNRSLLI